MKTQEAVKQINSKGLAIAMLASFLVSHSGLAHEVKKKAQIQVGIALDTSGSMGGLIDQTKTQLWKIVNELTKARKNGELPELKVALYQYGAGSLKADEGFLALRSPLTTDLDAISQELFALRIGGSEEYSGMVIKSAVDQLSFSHDPKDYKAIFIAGNETFNQGPVNHREAAAQALGAGILVNTIHCGTKEQGVAGLWNEAADITGGSALNIDQNQRTPYIESPYDEQIKELNQQLNDTYIPYGHLGKSRKDRQVNEDSNSGEGIVDRGRSKSSGYYRNPTWDLVDGTKEGAVKLEDIAEKDLPKEMQGMTLEQKKEYVRNKSEKRKAIQKQIQELYALREKYVAKKLEELNKGKADSVHSAMIKALRTQLESKGFQLVQE